MPYIVGISGGPSSGKSSVAERIQSQLKGQPEIVKLINFYKPMRGNMRRKSRSSSFSEPLDEREESEQIK
jgi:uridine kinase